LIGHLATVTRWKFKKVKLYYHFDWGRNGKNW